MALRILAPSTFPPSAFSKLVLNSYVIFTVNDLRQRIDDIWTSNLLL